MSKSSVVSVSTYVSHESIERKIYLIRGKKVMLDSDLAGLYEVDTKILNQAVRRNADRFPEDFMFQLSDKEHESLRFHFGTSKREGRGGRRYAPLAFTEQGIAMLSSVLNSKKAIHTNIVIIRTFTRLREFLLTHKDLQHRIDELEKKYDQQFQTIFQAIRQVLKPPARKSKPIGFHVKYE